MTITVESTNAYLTACCPDCKRWVRVFPAQNYTLWQHTASTTKPLICKGSGKVLGK